MKKSALYLLLLAFTVFSSCEKELKDYNLAIDLQSSFDQDNVQVFIDGYPEYDQKATTNQLLGLAGSTTTTRTEGYHQLKVVINNSTSKTSVFPLNANLYIGINYNVQSKEITVLYSNHPFGYD